jgi:hypothetical protein
VAHSIDTLVDGVWSYCVDVVGTVSSRLIRMWYNDYLAGWTCWIDSYHIDCAVPHRELLEIGFHENLESL